MPAAKLFLNWDNLKLYDINGAELTSLSGKNKTIRTYELAITQDGQNVPLPADSIVQAGVKTPGVPPGTMLSLANATRSGWGTGSRWYFTLDLTNPDIDAFYIGNTTAYNASFEIYMQLPDGQQIATVPMVFTINKNVIQAV